MLPVLYSFRRCPYAIRARMALLVASVEVELREVKLNEKPSAMLAISPNATVPVMQLSDGSVIDQSLDIMLWALRQHDPQNLLGNDELLQQQLTLIDENDTNFKPWLDRYKYHVAYPEQPQVYYRQQAEGFINKLEIRLSKQPMLFSQQLRLADLAIFPFVRQFAYVDIDWFNASGYQHTQAWLQHCLQQPLFIQAMEKYPVWDDETNAVRFGVL